MHAPRRVPSVRDPTSFRDNLGPWDPQQPGISVILPAKNEAEGLRRTLPALRQQLPDAEIIVVNDGSTDDTAAVAAQLGATVLSSPYSMGNGAAIKRGARAANGEVLVFMDADGQHVPARHPTAAGQVERRP